MLTETKFYKQPKLAKLAGVCAGWAEFTGQDVRFVRFMVLLCLLFPLSTAPTLFGYILLGILLESAPELAFDEINISRIATELDLFEHRIKLIENYVTSDNFALLCRLKL